jgi:hypothetical protein
MKRCEGCSFWQGKPSDWMGYCPMVERRTEAHDGARCQLYDARVVAPAIASVPRCNTCLSFDLSPTVCRNCGKAWK